MSNGANAWRPTPKRDWSVLLWAIPLALGIGFIAGQVLRLLA
jgi:hypothetical protein